MKAKELGREEDVDDSGRPNLGQAFHRNEREDGPTDGSRGVRARALAPAWAPGYDMFMGMLMLNAPWGPLRPLAMRPGVKP